MSKRKEFDWWMYKKCVTFLEDMPQFGFKILYAEGVGLSLAQTNFALIIRWLIRVIRTYEIPGYVYS